MFDLGTITRNLNAIKPVTVGIAKAMVRGGQEVISGAISGAKQPWYKSDLPGDAERQSVTGKLKWHADNISSLKGVDSALYANSDDLKKWVIAAYVDANSVEEGAAYIDASWNRMWSEIQSQLRAIPGAVLSAAGEVGGAILGVPPWAFWVGGALAVGLVGWGVWRLANSGAGQAAIRGYTGGLVGRRG